MNQTGEAWYIEQCLREIESQLQWGPPSDWSSYDMEKLSGLIQESTGVTLSVSTLKRLWGKVAYQNVPALNTLNTIAHYAGYDDWRQFKQYKEHLSISATTATAPTVTSTVPVASATGINSPDNTTSQRTTRLSYSKKVKKYFWLAALLLLVAAGYMVAGKKNSHPALSTVSPADSPAFQFKANKVVTAGIPNSVVFTYDARAAKTDSVFIVQTWDVSRRKWVPKDKHQYSAIYYYPGFFRAKLLADGKVMKTHDLFISTDGWLVLAEQAPEPLYFKKSEYLQQNEVSISKATLQSYNLPLHPQPPRLRFFNMQPMDPLMNDNFSFETTLKNEFNEGASACQRVQVLIQCKDDVIIIPLTAKPCIGDIFLYSCGKELTSKESDLSGFGSDLSQWTHLQVTSVNKHMTFLVNGKTAASFTFPNAPTGIVGVQFRFQGPAAIKDTRFHANNKEYEF